MSKFNARPISKIAFFLGYRLVLDFAYVLFISPLYGYAGMLLNPDLFKWALSMVVSFITYFIVTEHETRLSSLILTLLMAACYIPLSTYYSLSGAQTEYFLYVSFCYILLKMLIDVPFGRKFGEKACASAFTKAAGRFVTDHRSALLWITKACVVSICAACTILCAFILFRYMGDLNLAAGLDIMRVYEIREALELPTWADYVVSWQAGAVNPFLAGLFATQRKYVLALIPAAFQALLYLFTGNKIYLFLIALWLLFYLLCKTQKPANGLFGTISAGIVASSILYVLSSLGRYAYLLVYRTFFIQPQIEFSYFRFFNGHVNLLFSEGRLGHALGLLSPYPIEAARVISMSTYGSANTFTNTGFLAYGYADFGFLGMLIVTTLSALVLKYADVVLKKLPIQLVCVTLLCPLYGLANIPFFTTMLTNGTFVALLLLSLVVCVQSLKEHNR